MPAIYDNTDLLWTRRGDVVLGHDGDLADTYNDPLRSVVQEMRSRVEADFGDWYFHEDIAAALNRFVGEPNNKLTAENIKISVVAAITKYGLVRTSDVKVRYLPIDSDKLMIRIRLLVAPTARNVASQEVNIQLLYSYSENNVYIIPGR